MLTPPPKIMTIRIDYAPGRLPAFWDRSVVFFANLLALFYGNRGATEELATTVGGIETYGGRLCPVLNLLFRGGENLLVLESPPDDDLLGYFATDLGLEVPEIAILHHDRYGALCDGLRRVAGVAEADGEPAVQRSVPGDAPAGADHDPAVARIAEHEAPWLDGFVTDELLTDVAEVLGKRTIITPEISRQGNNKLLLHRFLEDRGFPVFDTAIVERPADIPAAAASLREKGYRRVVVKAQVGASGIGMRRLDAARPELDRVDEHMFYEGPCLVQGWLEEDLDGLREVGSPSVQVFLGERHVSLYDVTEQILSFESIHEGNRAPPPYWRTLPGCEDQMRDQAEAVGRWLHGGGYRGTASADFLVVERRGRIEVRLCEVNARVTGATYPSVLARRFSPDGCWLMRNLLLDPPIRGRDLLGALRRAGHLYTDGAQQGVLPINFNVDRAGLVRKGQFLCLGPAETVCLDLLMHAAGVLPVTWTYDRD